MNVLIFLRCIVMVLAILAGYAWIFERAPRGSEKNNRFYRWGP